MAQETASETVLPQSILPQSVEEILYEEAPGEGHEGLHLDKKIVPLGDDTYTVILEAYADSRTSTTLTQKPSDYCLVLDVSTSMSYFDYPGSPDGKRLGALKKTAEEFVELAAAQMPDAKEGTNGEAGEEAKEENRSRVSVVQFADEGHSKIVCGWTPLNSEGTGQVREAIEGLTCYHLTRTDLGMLLAEQLMAEDVMDREKIVILVTDGQPNNQDGFQPSVANSALVSAARMKMSGIRIYAVSIENSANVNAGAPLPEYEKSPEDAADPEFLYMFPEVSYEGGPEINTTNENAHVMTDRFMHLISSNNPRAVTMDKPDGADPDAAGRTVAEDGICYYLTAKDTAALSQVFETLASSSRIYDPALSESSQLRDVVAKDFMVRDTGAVRTFLAGRKANDQTASDQTAFHQTASDQPASVGEGPEIVTEPKWEEAEEVPLNVVASPDTVKVSGFNYREKKLTVQFDIIRRPESTAQGRVPTNAEISGVYENDSKEEALAYFPVPTVLLKGKDSAPVKEDTPKEDPGPSKSDTPQEDPAPVKNDTPKEDPSPAKEDAPKQEEKPQPGKPVFEINTNTATPEPTVYVINSDANTTPQPVVVQTAAASSAGTPAPAKTEAAVPEKKENPASAPAESAPASAAEPAPSAPSAAVPQVQPSRNENRPLPVTADESESGTWVLILAAVCIMIPVLIYVTEPRLMDRS